MVSSKSPDAVSSASTLASSGPPGHCLMAAAAKVADIKKMVQLASQLVCQLNHLLMPATFAAAAIRQ